MSYSGYWFVHPVPAEAAAHFRAEVDARLARAAVDHAAQWRSWLADPSGIGPRYLHADGSWHLTPASEAFSRLFASPALDELGLDVMKASALRKPDVRSLALRSETPLSVLFHGLGPARASRLPGFRGELLLSPAELQAARDELLAIFELDADERAAATQRIRSGSRPRKRARSIPPQSSTCSRLPSAPRRPQAPV